MTTILAGSRQRSLHAAIRRYGRSVRPFFGAVRLGSVVRGDGPPQ